MTQRWVRQPSPRPTGAKSMLAIMVSISTLALLAAVFAHPPAATADDTTASLTVIEQNFAVRPGERLRIKLVASGLPIVNLAAALTTTTTTTTTTSTTTPATVPDSIPVDGSVPVSTPPETAPAGSTAAPTDTAPAADAGDAVETTPDPLADVSLRIQIHRPVVDSSSVRAALLVDPGPVLDILEHPIRRVAKPQSDGSIEIVVDEVISDTVASETTLDALNPGVYPISLQVRRSATTLARTTTIFERAGTDTLSRGPVSLAVLMRIPSQPDADVAAEIEQLADLAERTNSPLSVAVDPDSLTTTLTENPTLAQRLRQALTSNDVILGAPLMPLDPSAATAADLDDLYRDWVDEGSEALRDALPSATVRQMVTIVDDDLTAAGATLLRDSGTQMMVTRYGDYAGFGDSIGPFLDTSLLSKVELDDDTTTPLLVVEPQMSALVELDQQPLSNEEELRRTVALAADIAVVRYGDKPDVRSLIVATPTYAPPPPKLVARALRLATGELDVTVQPITALIGLTNTQFVNGIPVTATLPSEPAVSLAPRLAASNPVRLVVADVTSMLPANDPRPARWTRELDETVRADWTDQQALEATAQVSIELETIRTSVLAPEPDPLTITGRTADLPIRIESRAAVPLTVRVHLDSDKLVFPTGDPLVTLTPNGVTSVVVPIESRTNGVIRLTLRLMTPAGNVLTNDVAITARFSTFSGMGQLITGALVLVLLSWWLSYFRRHRANRRAADLDTAADRHPSVPRADSSADSPAGDRAETANGDELGDTTSNQDDRDYEASSSE